METAKGCQTDWGGGHTHNAQAWHIGSVCLTPASYENGLRFIPLVPAIPTARSLERGKDF